MKYKLIKTRLAAALTALSACSATFAGVEDFRWPYNQATPVQFNITDVERSYHAWKNANLTTNNAGGNGRYRVMGGVNSNSTVSEGIAYGMLLTSLFDEQREFDGLWLFAQDHFDDQGLMHWYIGNPGQLLGQGAATDGDVDMAMALINACVKVQQSAWQPSAVGIDYCADATDLINKIYRYEVDKPGPQPMAGLDNNQGYELLPGDQWDLQNDYPSGIINLSYFPPGFFRVFGQFTNDEQKWQRVIDRNYALIDEVQSKPDNCSGLVANWNQYDGDPQVVPWHGEASAYWGWDAARLGWRVAVDATWYDAPDAEETVNELGSFFASVGVHNMGGEYQMNGRRIRSGANNFFLGNAMPTIVAASNLSPVNCGDATPSIKSTAQDAYDRALAGGIAPSEYYHAYWRLMGMLLMTGNFPNLYALANSSGSDPTVSLSQPDDGQVFPSGATVSLRANASDDGSVTQVEFFVDGQSAGVDVTSPYRIDVNALSDGAHTVYAEATDDDGNVASSSLVSISLVSQTLEAPEASMRVSVDGMTVNVNGADSLDADGTIVAYEWDFGDGTTSSGVTASHTYSQPGDYRIRLRVTDDDNLSDTDDREVMIDPVLSGGNECEYVILNEWNSGFVAEIRITNNGSSAINGWEVSWVYDDNSSMNSGWSARFSGTGPYVAQPYSWNSVIHPGQTVSFGLQGTKAQLNGVAQKPDVTGTVCN